MQLHQFIFRPSHKMLVILSNCKKRLPFPLLERATSCAYGFSPAPAPRTLHPGTSFARWTSSTVLCPLAAVHFALRSRQTLCPFENNLFHRTYLCRSRLAEAEGRSFFAERCRHPGGGFCAVLRGFGAYFSSPWAYPQQTAVRDSRSPRLSRSQPALFLGKRSIPWLWRCAFCAVSVFDSGRSLWAVPLQPPGRPSSRWGLRPCALCARSFRRLGVLCRFRICGFCASKRISTSEFSLDLESRFADFRVLGPSRWLPVDGESVRTRFPPGSIAFWRLCAPVLCFCLCPPKFCASRFGKSRSMEKEFPSRFLFGFSGSSAASLPALRQRRRSFRYACVVQLWGSSDLLDAASCAFSGPLPLRFRPSRPRRKSSDFRVSS